MKAALAVAVLATLLSAPTAHAAVAVEDLGTLPGHQLSTANDINNYGSIAGVSFTSDGRSSQAVRWDRYAPISKLDDLGFGSWAAGINDHAMVVGYVADSRNAAQAARWAVGTSGTQAVRWKAEEFTTPVPLAPSPSAAAEINNAGTVAGTVGSWAATWDAGGTRTMLPVPAGSNRSTVTDLSEDNQVIGTAGFPGGTYHAVVWR